MVAGLIDAVGGVISYTHQEQTFLTGDFSEIAAVVATTLRDEENGWSYTTSALRELADSAKNIPVIFEKKRIGRVTKGIFEKDKVLITATIDRPDTSWHKQLFLVPGGLTDFETSGDLIQKCGVHQFFITEVPSDKTLTPLAMIEP